MGSRDGMKAGLIRFGGQQAWAWGNEKGACISGGTTDYVLKEEDQVWGKENEFHFLYGVGLGNI